MLTILRTTGVVTLIAEDKVGGICRWYYRKSVVLSTKTLKALPRSTVGSPKLVPGTHAADLVWRNESTLYKST
jgi:hypothetical protein